MHRKPRKTARSLEAHFVPEFLTDSGGPSLPCQPSGKYVSLSFNKSFYSIISTASFRGIFSLLAVRVYPIIPFIWAATRQWIFLLISLSNWRKQSLNYGFQTKPVTVLRSNIWFVSWGTDLVASNGKIKHSTISSPPMLCFWVDTAGFVSEFDGSLVCSALLISLIQNQHLFWFR